MKGGWGGSEICGESHSTKHTHSHDTCYNYYMCKYYASFSSYISQKQQNRTSLKEVYSGITYINRFGEKHVSPNKTQDL